MPKRPIPKAGQKSKTSTVKYPPARNSFLKLRDAEVQLSFQEKLRTQIGEISSLETDLFLVSFFSGSGLLDLGFETAGITPIFVNEWNPEFLAAYQHSRRKMGIPEPVFDSSTDSVDSFLTHNKARLKEITTAAKSRGLVGFIGGPPCPDFSVGGKNRGRHGDNGKLTKTYFDLVIQNEPDWFLFENVKGLWSTRRHREFYEENIKAALNAGYAITDTLINAIEYGAPQDRDRIIAVGFSKHICQRLGLEPGKKIPAGVFPWNAEKKYERESVFALPWPETNPFGGNPSKPAQVPKELTVSHWFRTNDVENHPNANHCFKPRAGLSRFLEVAEGDDSRKSYKRLHRWRYSPTACYGNNEVHLHPSLPRRISVAEALAIQSLPKCFELPEKMTLSAMFKTIGNGVPYLAGRGLANTIKGFLEEKL